MQHLFRGAAEHGEDDAAQWLRLRYGREGGVDDVAMVVGLPKKRGALAALIASLHPDRVRSIRSSFAFADVSVRLPRFRVEGGFSAKQMLRDLGMVLAFDCTPGSEADLSGIAGAPGELCVSEVLHKAFVDVNEQGTEAAAATAVLVPRVTSVGPPPKTFFADHPFLVWIEHVPSGTLLFLGAVSSP